VVVSGIVFVFMGSVIGYWSCAPEFIDYGGPNWGIDH